jgi:NTP pyrophosphatase (non-canonical NTP hydrolase)
MLRVLNSFSGAAKVARNFHRQKVWMCFRELIPNPYLAQHTSKRLMTLRDSQQIVDEWISTIGVRYFNELTNTAILMEEVGELARIMAREYGEQSWKAGAKKEDLGDEMADVLFVLICLANQTGVNLEEALLRNLEKKTNRDLNRHRDNEKLKD